MKLIFILLLLCPTHVFAEQSISSLSIAPTPGNIGEPVHVTINVSNTPPIWCGISISFGDGTVEDQRMESDTSIIPHSYKRAGTFTVSIEGKFLVRGLKSASACKGSAQSASIVVVDPKVEREKAVAAQNELTRKAALEENERALREREQQLKSREEAIKMKLLEDREKILKAREAEIILKEKEALMNNSTKDSPPKKPKVLNPLNAF